MLVRDVMTTRPECVGPDDTLHQAAERMRDRDIGPLPVCDNDRLAGILTDRDIVVRCVAEGKDPRTARVREAMSEGVTYCFEDDDVKDAARVMKEKQVRRLVVLNHDKQLTGIVSLGDLAVGAGDQHTSGQVLEAISQPS